MSHNLRLLPKGLYDFEKLHVQNYIYVDKTSHIHKLITQGNYYFLSRPRRFGKSLLISTLKQIFLGNKQLFEGLAIDSSNFEWKEHPVIQFNFFELPSENAQDLKFGLYKYLDIIAQEHGITLDSELLLEQKFSVLIKQVAAKKGRVVILVDEYDHPIISNFSNLTIARECREVLRRFYGVIKSLDESLRFVFFTGVSKFAKTSIFSELNNLEDLTMTKKASTLLGYTHLELLDNFSEHITYTAHELKQTPEQIVEQMLAWYDGYQFSEFAEVHGESTKVYNPYSVLLFLDDASFKNYWFKSGSPKFLFELIKKQEFLPIELSDMRVAESEFESFEIDHMLLHVALYQTGYLTVESYDTETRTYRLKFPNQEVEVSFLEQLRNFFVPTKRREIKFIDIKKRNVQDWIAKAV